MPSGNVLPPTTCDSTSTLGFGLPHVSVVLALVPFSLLSVVLRTLLEDVLEPVHQVGVLVVDSACPRQVTPLHPFAQNEHSEDWMRPLNSLPLDEGFNLLD